jgi:hypothetical protein
MAGGRGSPYVVALVFVNPLICAWLGTRPDRPRIVEPSHRLALAWRGREIELRGYLDVYMTLLT